MRGKNKLFGWTYDKEQDTFYIQFYRDNVNCEKLTSDNNGSVTVDLDNRNVVKGLEIIGFKVPRLFRKLK